MKTTSRQTILLFLLLILTPAVSAQKAVASARETVTLRVTHHETGAAVEGIHYVHGTFQGVSDEKGTIQLTLMENTSLVLSHINFGTTVIAPPELAEMVVRGTISLDPKPRLIHSVRILGVRPKKESREQTALKSIEALSHDAGSILTRIPSISGIRKGGGYGLDPVMRGFKYDQVKILIDGIQTTTVACPNRMDPPTSQVSVNTLSAVEIHKGPYTLRYGNNIGGVINFQTANHFSHGAAGPFGRISGGVEANGTVLRTEALAGIRTEKAMFRLTGSVGSGNDYTDGNGNPVPASFTRANAGLATAFRLTDKQEIGASFTRNFARDADYPALPMDLRSDDTWLIQVKHDATLGGGGHAKKISTSLYASLVDHLMDNIGKPLDPRMLNAETAVKTRNIGGRTELAVRQETSAVVAGIDVNVENADGYRTREFLMGPNAGNTLTDNVWQNGIIYQSGAFAEYTRIFSQWRLSASGRVNVNRSDAGQPDPSFESLYDQLTTTQVNPGITGGIEHLGSRFSWAVWAGRVQRSGNLSERFMNSFPVGLDPYELIGNPALRPEINNQADLILEFRSGKQAKIELDIFYSHLQDFISSVIRDDLTPKMPSAPGVRQFTNINNARMTGAEISYIQPLPLNLRSGIDLAATYGTDLESGEPLPEIPPVDLRWMLEGSYLENRLVPAVYLRYVLKQDRISTAFGETETPSFWLLDLDVSYRFGNRVELSGGIRNLFDTAYYEHLNRSVRGTGGPIYNPGRNVFAAVSVKFGG